MSKKLRLIVLFTVAQSILYICQFAMCGISKPDQWQTAQALYVVGLIGECGPFPFSARLELLTAVFPFITVCKEKRY